VHSLKKVWNKSHRAFLQQQQLLSKGIDGKFYLNFDNSNIISYFINWWVTDKLPTGDFKAINKSAEYSYICGHIQTIL